MGTAQKTPILASILLIGLIFFYLYLKKTIFVILGVAKKKFYYAHLREDFKDGC